MVKFPPDTSSALHIKWRYSALLCLTEAQEQSPKDGILDSAQRCQHGGKTTDAWRLKDDQGYALAKPLVTLARLRPCGVSHRPSGYDIHSTALFIQCLHTVICGSLKSCFGASEFRVGEIVRFGAASGDSEVGMSIPNVV